MIQKLNSVTMPSRKGEVAFPFNKDLFKKTKKLDEVIPENKQTKINYLA